MENKGHSFFVSARDKEVTHSLLKYYSINFTSRGKGRKSLLGKLFHILEADYKIFKLAKKFKPDIFLSFGSAYAAHVSKLLNKPHIAFDDTEHARFEHLMYYPFSDAVLTPSCFGKKLGPKQIFFDGYMELCYLNQKYFRPDDNIKSRLGISAQDNFIIIRLVSWSANHDLGQSGIKSITKERIIDLLKDKFTIFISSEAELPEHLLEYKLKINPADLHSVLAAAFLYIGEGSTTASECSVLGTPNIYINSLTVGYCKEQHEKYDLCYHLKDDKEVISLIEKLISKKDLKSEWKIKNKKMQNDKIDVTAFMVWFIENYPASFVTMQENPEYQFNFK